MAPPGSVTSQMLAWRRGRSATRSRRACIGNHDESGVPPQVFSAIELRAGVAPVVMIPLAPGENTDVAFRMVEGSQAVVRGRFAGSASGASVPVDAVCAPARPDGR